MSPKTIGDRIVRDDAPLLHTDDTIEHASRKLLESDLPALPVVSDERFAGIFGEREFMAAVFPGYVKQLKYAGFVSHSLDDALQRNDACRQEPVSQHMNTEHVDVPSDYSDLQIAETFLHHRVLVVPVVDDGRVVGIITRSAFFEAVAGRFLD